MNFDLPPNVQQQLTASGLAHAAEVLVETLVQIEAALADADSERALRPARYNLKRLAGSLRRLQARQGCIGKGLGPLASTIGPRPGLGVPPAP